MVKHSVNPDLTQDVDFKVVFLSQFWLLSVCDAKVRLDRGGDAMVFAHVASNYFTLKGSTFCGRSASHVVFDKVKTFLCCNINIDYNTVESLFRWCALSWRRRWQKM